MERFLIIYRGASEPGERQEDRWAAWFEALGPALLDPGSLTQDSIEIPSRLLGPKPSGGSLSGYSVIEAADFDAVVRLAQDCPIFDERGSVEIARLGAGAGAA
ncbi:hypothetical protein ABIB38_001251 [Massilia sp. UYP11]|uniref:hypothetical protein n=1 Tax=Massilia sp. UYP11 TaxID=1756385 RepID=UPI003D22DFDB